MEIIIYDHCISHHCITFRGSMKIRALLIEPGLPYAVDWEYTVIPVYMQEEQTSLLWEHRHRNGNRNENGNGNGMGDTGRVA